MTTASTAVFLALGFDPERHAVSTKFMDQVNGFDGLVHWLVSLAERLEKIWEAEQCGVEGPGVYDYEITQPLGVWVYQNHQVVLDNPELFDAELRRKFKEWIA